MSKKLDDILSNLTFQIIALDNHHYTEPLEYEAKADIKALFLEIVGDVSSRETTDMSLSSWTAEDYKEFGKNELKIELRKAIGEL